MRSIWRVLLVWLTVLAMPIQGIAASGMLHCARAPMPTHPHVHVHDLADRLDHAHAGEVVSAAVPGHSDHHVGSDGAEGAPAGEAEASSSGHKCSACAACCPGAALPASTTGLPAPEHSSAPRVGSSTSAASFIAGGLERPPRHLLA